MLIRLAAALRASGADVTLVVADGGGPLRAAADAAAPVVDLHRNRVLSAIPPLIRHLRTWRPDVLISAKDHANVAAIVAASVARAGTRVVVTCHSPPSQSASHWRGVTGRALPLARSVLLTRAAAVVAVSSGVADDVARQTRVPRRQIDVIGNAVVTDDLLAQFEAPSPHPWLADPRHPVVLGLGRLAPEKDFSTLVRAFSIARGVVPELRLLIVGDGPEADALKGLLSTLGLADVAQLPGATSVPGAWMSRAAVFALSSRWEGLPTTLIEALAAGVRVVATDCPAGPREILRDGELGALVPPGDATALAEAIVKAVRSDRVPPPADAVARFTVDVVVKQYLELCERLLR